MERLLGSFSAVYVHLWIAEGALRKWVPGVGELMYVARDLATGVVLAIVVLSHARARRSAAAFWVATVAIIIAGAAAVVVAGLPPQVAVAGVRSYLAPFLLPVIVLCYAPRQASGYMARAVLIWIPIQLVLGAIQGSLPPESPINRELSGEESRFVQGGVVRITGTFTAPSGLTSYIILAFALTVAAVLSGHFVRRSVSIALLLMTITTVAISGSRGAVLGAAIVLVFVLLHSVITRPGLTVRLIATIGLVGGAAWVTAIWLFPQIVEAFINRFEAADRAENTSGRLVGQALGFVSPDNFSIFGSGVGGSSIIGIALGSGQTWVEVESTRWVTELGLVGLVLAATRLVVGVAIAAWVLIEPWRFDVAFASVVAVVCQTLILGSVGQNPSYQGAFGVSLALAITLFGSPTSAPPPSSRPEEGLFSRESMHDRKKA